MLKLGSSHCVIHGDVPVFIRHDGTIVHYTDETEDGVGKPCYGAFVESPPPEPLQEWEWELIFELEGEIYGTEIIV